MKYLHFTLFWWNIFEIAIGQYFVTNSSYGFLDIPCTLAQPRLIYGQDKITADLSDIDLQNGESVWVGYGEAYGAFDYIGCVSSKDFNLSVRLPESIPGYCYSYCNSTFGIFGTKCYCLQDDLAGLDIQEKYCETVCANTKDILCGGTSNGETYLSIYSFIEDKLSNTTTGNCLQLITTRKIVWNNCNNEYRVMCFNAIGNNVDEFSMFLGWKDSVIFCISSGHFPMTYNTLHLKHESQQESLWTGVMRSKTIMHMNGNGIWANRVPGVLKNGNNGFVLEFPRDEKTLRAICKKDTSQSPNDPTLPPTTNTTSTLTKETMSSKVFSLIGSAISSQYAPTVSKDSIQSKEKDDNQAATAGAAVGVTIVVVITSTVVVVVICLRRRKLASHTKTTVRQDEQKQRVVSVSNDYDVIPDIMAKDIGSKQQDVLQADINACVNPKTVIEAIDTNYCNDYSHREQKMCNADRSSGDTNEPHNKASDNTYFVLENHVKAIVSEDGVYNATDAFEESLPKHSDNIYNILDEKGNVTYDHIGNQSLGSKDRQPDNTYDTKETVQKMHHKHNDDQNMYSKIFRVELTDNEIETYNHVVKNFPKNFNKSHDNSEV